MDEEQIRKLLDRLLTEKSNDEREREQSGKDFNIFECLGIEDKELVLCRMLQQLLDPKGKHGQGDLFLRVFCEQVLKDIKPFPDDELKSARVLREYRIPKNRRIDIVIETDYRVIPIEAKTKSRPEEQKDQVSDYCRFTSEKMEQFGSSAREWKLYYLTLYGTMPSEGSMSDEWKNSGRVQCISWKEDISEYLAEVLNHSLPERVRQIITQYKEAVDRITGNDMNAVDTLDKVIQTPKDMEAAEYICSNLNAKKTEFLRSLFKRLEDKVKASLHGTPEASHLFDFSNQISQYYRKKESTRPGISWMLKEVTDHCSHADDYRYFLNVRFEMEWRPYVGICIARQNQKDGTYSRYDIRTDTPELAAWFKKLITDKTLKDRFKCDGWWLYWVYVPDGGNEESTTTAPDFRWPDEYYYQLYDRDSYNSFVEKTVDAILRCYNSIDWSRLG